MLINEKNVVMYRVFEFNFKFLIFNLVYKFLFFYFALINIDISKINTFILYVFNLYKVKVL